MHPSQPTQDVNLDDNMEDQHAADTEFFYGVLPENEGSVTHQQIDGVDGSQPFPSRIDDTNKQSIETTNLGVEGDFADVYNHRPAVSVTSSPNPFSHNQVMPENSPQDAKAIRGQILSPIRGQILLPGLGASPTSPYMTNLAPMRASISDTSAIFTPSAAQNRHKLVPKLRNARGRPSPTFSPGAGMVFTGASNTPPYGQDSPKLQHTEAQVRWERDDGNDVPVFAEMPADISRVGDAPPPASVTDVTALPRKPRVVTIDQAPRDDDDDIPLFADMPSSVLNNGAVVAGAHHASSSSSDEDEDDKQEQIAEKGVVEEVEAEETPREDEEQAGLRQEDDGAEGSSSLHSLPQTPPQITTWNSSSREDPDSDEDPLGDLNMLSSGPPSEIEEDDALHMSPNMISGSPLSNLNFGDSYSLAPGYSDSLSSQGHGTMTAMTANLSNDSRNQATHESDAMQIEPSIYEWDHGDREQGQHDTAMLNNDIAGYDDDFDVAKMDVDTAQTSSDLSGPGIRQMQDTDMGETESQIQSLPSVFQSDFYNRNLELTIKNLQAENDKFREEKYEQAELANDLKDCRKRLYDCENYRRKLEAEIAQYKRSQAEYDTYNSNLRQMKQELPRLQKDLDEERRAHIETQKTLQQRIERAKHVDELSTLPAQQQRGENWSPFSRTSAAQRKWLDGMVPDTNGHDQGQVIPRWRKFKQLAELKARKRENERLESTAEWERQKKAYRCHLMAHTGSPRTYSDEEWGIKLSFWSLDGGQNDVRLRG
nr:hypothetical protein CFP56_26016 [Quercus suber]